MVDVFVDEKIYRINGRGRENNKIVEERIKRKKLRRRRGNIKIVEEQIKN